MIYKTPNFLFRKIFLVVGVLFLSACASLPGGPSKGDPFESYNRAMFSFNDNLDEYILRPVSEGYDKILPSPIKTGVSNFFSNLGDIFVIINDLLQFKFTQAIGDTSRFILNTTMGFGGLIDVATPIGLPKHDEDFGQTFATWGIPQGPYVILPFFGSRTLLGTGGFVIESVFDPVYNIEKTDTLYATASLRFIDARYNLLDESRIVDQAALDKYSFVRDAYLQHRKNLIYDGKPPVEKTIAPPKSNAEDLELEKLLEF